MQIQNQVGPVASAQSIAPGTIVPGRAGQLGDYILSELHGRYYEQTYRRNIFLAAQSTGGTCVAFTSGTTVTAIVGVTLTNPIGSTVNLVMLKVGVTWPVINTTVNTAIIAAGYNASSAVTQTTALTVRNAFIGVGPSGQGLAASTVTTPTAANTIVTLMSMPTATTLPSAGLFDMEGSIILPPGAYAHIITSAASAASGFQASVSWEEVPV